MERMAKPRRTALFAHARYEDRRLAVIAQETGEGTVLDVGYANMPNPYFGDRRVTGIDLQDSGVSAPYEETLVGDATALDGPLGGRTFDTVVAGELIEHLEDPYAFLRGVRPLIASEGRLVISTPNPTSFPVVFFEWMASRSYFYAEDHAFLAPPRWVDRMLADSGFRLIRHVPVGLWLPPFPAIRCPVALSYQVIYVAEPA